MAQIPSLQKYFLRGQEFDPPTSNTIVGGGRVSDQSGVLYLITATCPVTMNVVTQRVITIVNFGERVSTDCPDCGSIHWYKSLYHDAENLARGWDYVEE